MSLSIRLMPEPVRTLAFGAISAVYAGIGTQVTRPIRMIFIQNLTDVILMYSFDGVDDHFPLPTTGYIIIDITANKTRDDGFFLAEGQRIYVRDMTAEGKGAATTGDVYVTTFYGANL